MKNFKRTSEQICAYVRGLARFRQTSTMKSFVTIVNYYKPLTIVAKLLILDACGEPGHTSVFNPSRANPERREKKLT